MRHKLHITCLATLMLSRTVLFGNSYQVTGLLYQSYTIAGLRAWNFTAWRNLGNFSLFEEIRKWWHTFYNCGLWKIIISIRNKQPLHLSQVDLLFRNYILKKEDPSDIWIFIILTVRSDIHRFPAWPVAMDPSLLKILEYQCYHLVNWKNSNITHT